MTESKSDRVRRIVATLLRVPLAELGREARLGHTPRWDSLAQLDILAACEEEFGLTIEPEQAVDLTTLDALITHIEQHA
jgi:acyl carrier protein